MVDIPDQGCESASGKGAPMSVPMADVRAWFVREVLPLEAVLMQFLRRSARDDAEDLRQEVYMRVCESAAVEIPRAGLSHLRRAIRTWCRLGATFKRREPARLS